MFEATGNAKYVDVLEITLLNAVLGGMSLDGTKYFYTNPLRQVDPLPTKLRWPRERASFVTSYCCPPNLLRVIGEVAGYAYAKSDNAIWVNLYGSNRLTTDINGREVKLKQDSHYPWDEKIAIRFEKCPSIDFSLNLRIPGWADRANLTVNGSALDVALRPATYATIHRAWRLGDTVELVLPMQPKLIEAHPLVEEDRGQVAIQRGPIVYCLESIDLPEGVRITDVSIPRDATLVAKPEKHLPGGMNIIEATCVAQPIRSWAGKLYRPMTSGNDRKFNTHFIPYYAWGNRGTSEMSVWLPVK
jgi:DUF1680 family protein